MFFFSTAVVLTAYIPAQKKITAESLKQALISAYFPRSSPSLFWGVGRTMGENVCGCKFSLIHPEDMVGNPTMPIPTLYNIGIEINAHFSFYTSVS